MGSDEWGQHASADPSHGSFVSSVVQRLISKQTGNVHSESLEHDVAMLCPSLLRAGRPVESGDFHAMRPLAARLRLELAGRTTAAVTVDDAPSAIWVPRDDLELQARLQESTRATAARLEEARAAALARAAAASTVKPRPKTAPAKKLEGEALDRLVTKILRHTAVQKGLNMRSDGYVRVEELLN